MKFIDRFFENRAIRAESKGYARGFNSADKNKFVEIKHLLHSHKKEKRNLVKKIWKQAANKIDLLKRENNYLKIEYKEIQREFDKFKQDRAKLDADRDYYKDRLLKFQSLIAIELARIEQSEYVQRKTEDKKTKHLV